MAPMQKSNDRARMGKGQSTMPADESAARADACSCCSERACAALWRRVRVGGGPNFGIASVDINFGRKVLLGRHVLGKPTTSTPL